MDERKMSREELIAETDKQKKKIINMTFDEVRRCGEKVGVTAATAFKTNFGKANFMEQVESEFKEACEKVSKMSGTQIMALMFARALEATNGDIDELMEGLK